MTMAIRIHITRLTVLVGIILPFVLAACGNGGKGRRLLELHRLRACAPSRSNRCASRTCRERTHGRTMTTRLALADAPIRAG